MATTFGFVRIGSQVTIGTLTKLSPQPEVKLTYRPEGGRVMNRRVEFIRVE